MMSKYCGKGEMVLNSLTFENTGKGEMLQTSIFSYSCNVFYPSHKELLFLSGIHFVVCKCLQFGRV